MRGFRQSLDDGEPIRRGPAKPSLAYRLGERVGSLKYAWRDLAPRLAHPMPIYVTRPTAGGDTGTISVALWMVVAFAWLGSLNVLLWGLVGLKRAVRGLRR